jgi:hypothetical protein
VPALHDVLLFLFFLLLSGAEPASTAFDDP